jgi:RNA polymerase sigma-70 factor (ECF subfamily)
MDALVLNVRDVEGMFALPTSAGRAAAAAPIADVIGPVYDAHQRELFTFALRACRDRDVAEDLVHEAFVRLIVEVEAGRMPRTVRAWLYRVVANLVFSRQRHTTVAERHLGATAAGEGYAGPESAYIVQERNDAVDLALGELGEDARTALLMAANGFNGMEIAEAIGRSANATRTLMCRTRLQLRQRLASFDVPA